MKTVYEDEVQQAREFFRGYDRAGFSRSIHAPFHPVEAAYRSGQLLVLSELLRQTGRLSLEGMTILDFGSGSGRMLRAFIDMGTHPGDLFGVDINEDRVSVARDLVPSINFKVCNGWKLEFPDRHFDLVTQFVVFSSIAAAELRKHVAEEMMRVLKPGGFIFWWDFFKLVGAAADGMSP